MVKMVSHIVGFVCNFSLVLVGGQARKKVLL